MRLWTNTHLASRGAILLFMTDRDINPELAPDKLWIFTQFNGYSEKDIDWLGLH